MLSVTCTSIRYCWINWFDMFQYSTYKFPKKELDFLLYCVNEYINEYKHGYHFFKELRYRPNERKVVRNTKKFYVESIFEIIDNHMFNKSHEYFISFMFDNRLHRSRIIKIRYYDSVSRVFLPN